MKHRCVIFDCDGTLLDTLGDIAAVTNKGLALNGFLPVPQENFRDMVGWGMARLAELALPQEARSDASIKLLADYISQNLEEGLTKPYPGISEMLAGLCAFKDSRSKKIVTAVLSNKPDAALGRAIHKFFSPYMFDAICGLRPGVPGKPDPALVWETLTKIDRLPQDTIFVGDSEVDIETAINAGCFPLGVTWGFRSRATLEKAGAARIIDKPEELLEFFK